MRAFIAAVFILLAASARSAEFPRGEMYPARSGRLSDDQERAIAVASERLAGHGKRLDAFYQVTRRGKDYWVLVLVTGGRAKWGQEGFAQPAFYIVVVSPKWTVKEVISGRQQ